MTSSKCFDACVVSVVALGLSACTALPVKYFSGRAGAVEAGASMKSALGYLGAARSQYQAAVETQMNDERTLAAALIGGGALMTALAMGGVHRDVIAGGALLAGTGYTLGNLGLPRSRVLAYLAGVDALTCAERAIAPLGVASSSLGRLDRALGALERSRLGLTNEMSKGRVLQFPAGSTDGRELKAALALGTQVMQASETTLKAGRGLLETSAQAARELVSAVNGIDDAVVRSLVSSTPDLSAVPRLVHNLAGLSAAFVPSSGVDPATAANVDKAAASASAKAAVAGVSAVLAAADAITAAAQETTARDAEAQSLMPRQAVAWPADAFKSCGVAEVVSALTASTSALHFTAGADDRQTVEIYGGVKPYFVRIDGPAVDGLTVKPPLRFDNQAELVAVGARLKTAVEARLRILDSTPGSARTLNLPLTVAAAASEPARSPDGTKKPAVAKPVKPVNPAPSAPLPGAAASAATGGTSAEKLALARIKAKGAFTLGGKPFALAGIPVLDGGAIVVRVICPAGAVQTRAAVGQALLAQAGVATTPLPALRISAQPAACLSD